MTLQLQSTTAALIQLFLTQRILSADLLVFGSGKNSVGHAARGSRARDTPAWKANTLSTSPGAPLVGFLLTFDFAWPSVLAGRPISVSAL